MRAKASEKQKSLSCLRLAIGFAGIALAAALLLAPSAGEAKFHQEIKQAIKGAAKEIKKGAKEAFGTVKKETKKAVDDDETPKWTKADAKRAYRGELTRKDIILIQDSLNKLGYGAGPTDGIASLQTRSAVARFQATQNTTTDGKLSHTLMEQLNEAVATRYLQAFL